MGTEAEKAPRPSSDMRDKASKLVEESSRWLDAFRDPKLVARRQRVHLIKLKRMGVLDWPRDQHVLDLCCGTGELLRILHDQKFAKLSGVDVTLDPHLQKEPWVNLTAGDCRALPYPDATFDAVLCMHAMHHMGGIEGVSKALQEVLRVLKPGGRVALVDFYDSSWLRFTFWCFRKPWLTWPTSGLKSFGVLVEEEWPYLLRYMNEWPQVRKSILDLGMEPVRDTKRLYFFYWVGKKK